MTVEVSSTSHTLPILDDEIYAHGRCSRTTPYAAPFQYAREKREKEGEKRGSLLPKFQRKYKKLYSISSANADWKSYGTLLPLISLRHIFLSRSLSLSPVLSCKLAARACAWEGENKRKSSKRTSRALIQNLGAGALRFKKPIEQASLEERCARPLRIAQSEPLALSNIKVPLPAEQFHVHEKERERERQRSSSMTFVSSSPSRFIMLLSLDYSSPKSGEREGESKPMRYVHVRQCAPRAREIALGAFFPI